MGLEKLLHCKIFSFGVQRGVCVCVNAQGKNTMLGTGQIRIV